MDNLFFITTDPSLALGVATTIKNTWIITINRSEFVNRLESEGYRIWCLDDYDKLAVKTVGHLLQNDKVISFINQNSKNQTSKIIVFKNSSKIEHLCKLNNFYLIANSRNLSKYIEDKFNLNKFVDDKFLVSSHILESNFEINKIPIYQKYVIQTSQGWAGSSTWICNNRGELINQLNKLGERTVKISKFINSPTLTINVAIGNKKYRASKLGWQINCPDTTWALKSSTTCGRQWDQTIDDNLEIQKQQIVEMMVNKLTELGYKGYFGLDLMVEDGFLKVLEINPRLTASESFYSRKELEIGISPLVLYHLEAFTDSKIFINNDFNKDIIGCQLVVRNNRSESININESIACDVDTNNKIELLNSWRKTENQIWSSVGEISQNGEIVKFESGIPIANQSYLNNFWINSLSTIRDHLINNE